MRKVINRENLEGIVYEHNLVKKTVQNQQSDNFGKEFISGTISIAVDDEGKNIVENHFTYVSPTTKAGSTNATFTALDKIINENKTWLSVGKDEAQKVKINTSLSVNDFINKDNELISAKRNEGGFVTLVNAITPKEDDRHKFTFDMVINGTIRKEPNEETGTPEYVVVKGGIFNFRNEWQPVELTVETEAGMDYFEDLGASNKEPIFTQVWGTINTYKTVRTITEESAFGEDSVRTLESNRKVWSITGAHKEPYDFGEDGEDLTSAELKEILQNREVFLADVKKRDEEYKASRAANSTPSMAAASAVQSGEFNF